MTLTERIEKVLALDAKRYASDIDTHYATGRDLYAQRTDILADEALDVIKLLQTELERLRLYARHSDNCLRGPGDCTCGLTK